MRKLWPLLLVAVTVAACTTNVRSERFDVAARAYERAMRWSDFGKAFAFSANTENKPDLEHLQHVRVTSYDLLGAASASADFSKMVQAVEIHYVDTRNMSERTLTDQQVWEYSEPDQRWKRTSPFPAFR